MMMLVEQVASSSATVLVQARAAPQELVARPFTSARGARASHSSP